MIPRFMAGLSAFGGLISDIRWEESGVHLTSDKAFDITGVNKVLQRLRQVGEQFLTTAGVPESLRRFEFAFMGRYEYQSWEIEVSFTAEDGSLRPEDVSALSAAFHQMHERIYSVNSVNDVVEFTSWKMKAIGKRPKQDSWMDFKLTEQRGPVEAKRWREVYVPEHRSMRRLPVYNMDRMGAGAELQGPCIVEAGTFTAFLRDNHVGSIDEQGNIAVTVA
jgi:N-methylhydantoinase A